MCDCFVVLWFLFLIYCIVGSRLVALCVLLCCVMIAWFRLFAYVCMCVMCFIHVSCCLMFAVLFFVCVYCVVVCVECLCCGVLFELGLCFSLSACVCLSLILCCV